MDLFDEDKVPIMRCRHRRNAAVLARHQHLSIRDAKVGLVLYRHRLSRISPLLIVPCLFYSFYCWGPSKSPMEMSLNEQVSWNKHLQTPVLFNHHKPIEINSSTIEHVDLNPIKSTKNALPNGERILILTPLKDAAPYLAKYFELLAELTYPHDLIDIAFLVGDSADDTMAVLAMELDRIQKRPDKIPFRNAMVVEKDFGFQLSQSVEDRHGFEAQGPRRKAMGRARNYLLSTALKPDHSWVYWRDVDIVDNPKEIIEDFIEHDRDILVPSRFACKADQPAKILTLLRRLVPSLRRRC